METPIKQVGVAKSGLLKDTLNCYHNKIFINRRTGKTKHLLNEALLHQNVYLPSSKQTGFLTSRPLKFLEAFEQVLTSGQFSSEWLNVPDDKGLYYECIIPLYEQTVKKVTIHVFLTTGVILFKGSEHDSWPRKYLPEILDTINNVCSSNNASELDSEIISTASPAELGNSTCPADQIYDENITHTESHGINLAMTTINEDVAEITAIVNENPKESENDQISMKVSQILVGSPDFIPATPPVSSPKITIPAIAADINVEHSEKIKNTEDSQYLSNSAARNITGLPELESQLKGLWAENKNLRTALATVDNGLQNVNKTLCSIQDSMTSQKNTFESMLQTFDKKFDMKLETFMSAMSDSVDKKIKIANSALQSKFQKDIENIKEVIGSHKIQIEKRLQSLNEPGTEDYRARIEREIENLKYRVQEIDIPSINRWSAEIDNLTTQQNKFVKSLDRLASENGGSDLKNLQTELTNISSVVHNLKAVFESFDFANMQHQFSELTAITRDVNSLKIKYDKPICDLFQQVNGMQNQLKNCMYPDTSHLRHQNIAVTQETATGPSTLPPPSIHGFLHASNSNIPSRFPIPQTQPIINPPQSQHVVTENNPGSNAAHGNQKTPVFLEQNFTNRNSSPARDQGIEKDILLLMDSNRKVLDFKRLWKSENTQVCAAPTLKDVYDTLASHPNSNLRCILIHCATNDIESKSLNQILDSIDKILHLVKHKFPNAKVLLSEVLIRSDHFDDIGIALNTDLALLYRDHDFVMLIRHGNIRREGIRVLRDEKHLLPSISGLFASNLQRGLKKVLPKFANSKPIYNNTGTYTQSAKPYNNLNKKTANRTMDTREQTRNFDKDNFCSGLIQAIQSFVGSF